MSRRDDVNLALSKVALSCLLRIMHHLLQDKQPSHVTNPLLIIKLFWPRWIYIGLALFLSEVFMGKTVKKSRPFWQGRGLRLSH